MLEFVGKRLFNPVDIVVGGGGDGGGGGGGGGGVFCSQNTIC